MNAIEQYFSVVLFIMLYKQGHPTVRFGEYLFGRPKIA